MKSYLSLIPISAKVHQRQNRMDAAVHRFLRVHGHRGFQHGRNGRTIRAGPIDGKAWFRFLSEFVQQLAGAEPFACRPRLVCFDPDRRGADDFQQYEQQRRPADSVFWNDALHRHE